MDYEVYRTSQSAPGGIDTLLSIRLVHMSNWSKLWQIYTRSIVSTIVTILLVSITLFFLLEVGSGDITLKILGPFATQEQRASYSAQLGLDAPAWQRYVDWLAGNDWRAEGQTGFPLVTLANPQTGEADWWADMDGQLTRWTMEEGQLIALIRQPDGSTLPSPAPDDVWRAGEGGEQLFWGVDTKNNAVKWVKARANPSGCVDQGRSAPRRGRPRQYIPLRKGLLRGDPGKSLQTGRPVAVTLVAPCAQHLILAGVAFPDRHAPGPLPGHHCGDQ